LADTVSKYFHKGKEIVVRGEMQSHKWTDKDGINRVSWEIMADSVDFCGSKSDNGTTDAPAKTESKPKADFVAIERDDDLPF
jgi:single-strand DNA-binding protein